MWPTFFQFVLQNNLANIHYQMQLFELKMNKIHYTMMEIMPLNMTTQFILYPFCLMPDKTKSYGVVISSCSAENTKLSKAVSSKKI